MSRDSIAISSGLRQVADAVDAMDSSVQVRSVAIDESSTEGEETVSVELTLTVPRGDGSGSGDDVAAETDRSEGSAETTDDTGSSGRPREVTDGSGLGPTASSTLSGVPGDRPSSIVPRGPTTVSPLSLRTAFEPGLTDVDLSEPVSPEEESSENDTDPDEDVSEADPPFGGDEGGTGETTVSTADDRGTVPAYKDPEKLRRVYDEYDSFREMTDALGVDVVPKTVREYMVRYGIHDVDSTSGTDSDDADADEAGEDRSSVPESVNSDPSGNHEGATDGGDGKPAYSDPELLEEVYEKYDSFPAMTEALGVDVTPQTVRRHMIDYGIHEIETRSPNSETSDRNADEEAKSDGSEDSVDGTSSDDGSATTTDGERTDDDASATSIEATEAVESTGGGEESDESGSDLEGISAARLAGEDSLVADRSVGGLLDLIATSQTAYELERELDADRESVRDLLSSLDALGFVYGRMSDRLEPAERRDELESLFREELSGSSA